MKIVEIKTKRPMHTSVDERVYNKVAAIATKHDLDKCDVVNSLLVLGIAAHERHQKKYVKAKRRASHCR